MDYKKIYRHIYSILNNVTPLPYDCGKLCKGACCQDNEVGTGMYLYPCEIRMFNSFADWAEIELSDFTYKYGNVHILSCKGKCNRDERPLACRIFPLVPYEKDGVVQVIMDPRAFSLCPVARSMKVSNEFKDAVFRVTNILKKTKEGREFIKEQSRLIDEYAENLI